MQAATALFASAAVLLVLAGVVKVSRPTTAADLMQTLGAPSRGPWSGTHLAVGLGVIEIALGVIGLVSELPAAAVAIGVLYVIFGLTVLRAMALGATSCGCFGRIESPPTWFHVFGNAVLAAAAFTAATASSPLEVMDAQPAGGIGFVLLVGVLAGLALVVFTALPEASAARQSKEVTS
jgi:hypothetical protein